MSSKKRAKDDSTEGDGNNKRQRGNVSAGGISNPGPSIQSPNVSSESQRYNAVKVTPEPHAATPEQNSLPPQDNGGTLDNRCENFGNVDNSPSESIFAHGNQAQSTRNIQGTAKSLNFEPSNAGTNNNQDPITLVSPVATASAHGIISCRRTTRKSWETTDHHFFVSML